MAEIIASGLAQADSADFTLAMGDEVTLLLKGGGGTSTLPNFSAADVQMLSGSQYITIGTLDDDAPCKVLRAPGTFRVRKYAAAIACGVDKV